MPVRFHGKKDAVINRIAEALGTYLQDHPRALIDIYRRTAVVARIRVVDADLVDLSRARRHALVWRYLEPLPEEILFHVSLLLLTPADATESLGNQDFEHELALLRKKTAARRKSRTKISM